MSTIWMAAALAAAGWGAPVSTPDRPQDKSAERLEGKALVEQTAAAWLKVYPLPINREIWRLEGAVKSLDRDLPRVREVFAKVGASQTGEKLSYRCPKESALKALAALRKVGRFKDPSVRHIVEPVSRGEVQDKIKALEADKAAHGAALAKMPAVSALVEELLGHLRGVETALIKPEVEVTLQLTVKEKNGS